MKSRVDPVERTYLNTNFCLVFFIIFEIKRISKHVRPCAYSDTNKNHTCFQIVVNIREISCLYMAHLWKLGHRARTLARTICASG